MSSPLWISRIGFPEMPDLNLKVTPVFGESKYSYTLIHDFLEARIRDELKVSGTRLRPAESASLLIDLC